MSKPTTINKTYRKKIQTMIEELGVDGIAAVTGYKDVERMLVSGYPRYPTGLTPRSKQMVDTMWAARKAGLPLNGLQFKVL